MQDPVPACAQAENVEPAKVRAAAGIPFFVLLLLFLTSYIAVTVTLSTSFHADEAEQLLFSQSLDAGYEAQPPLYSWLLQLFFAVFGRSFLAFALLKALSLGAVFVGLYAAAGTMLEDEARARLAAFSIFLIPLFTWSAVGYLTHTILVAAACTWTCYALLRLQDGRERHRYVFLGVMLALGTLTKYNYVLFAAALFLAGLTVRGYRRRLLEPRMLLALAVGAALVWPHALYVAGHWQDIAQLLRLKADAAGSTSHGAGKAVRDLFTSMVLILTPLAVVSVVLFPSVVRRKPNRDPGLSGGSESAQNRASLRLLERYFLVLLCLLALVIAGGAKRFNDRWIQPFTLLAPLYLFGRLRGVTLPRWRVRSFALILTAGAVIVIGVRIGQLLLGGSSGCPFALRSFGEAASRLEAELGPPATTVASQRGVSGNLCYWLPHLRHFCSDRPMYLPKKGEPQGRCAVVWEAFEGDQPPPALTRFLTQTWHLRIPPGMPVHELDVLSPRGQRQRLWYIVLPADFRSLSSR